jgi:hypothetical protein
MVPQQAQLAIWIPQVQDSFASESDDKSVVAVAVLAVNVQINFWV